MTKRKLSGVGKESSPLLRRVLENFSKLEQLAGSGPGGGGASQDSMDEAEAAAVASESEVPASDVVRLFELFQRDAQKEAAPGATNTGAAEGREGRPVDDTVPREASTVKLQASLGNSVNGGGSGDSGGPTDGSGSGSGSGSGRRPSIPGAVEFTDLDNAFRLATEYGRDIKFCEEWGKWLAWDGRRWESGKTSSATRAAAGFAFDAMKEATAYKLPSKDDPSYEKERAKKASRLEAAKSLQSRSRLGSMIHLASHSSAMAVKSSELDVDAWTLNTMSGTVNLRTGQMVQHKREDLLTKITGASYDPEFLDEDCPEWIKFMDTVTCGDQDLARYLQKIVGYSLTGTVGERALFIFFGLGSNGKGTFLRVMQEVMGDYAQPAPQGMLEEKHSDDHPSRIASLYRARLTICAEVEKNSELAEALVKDLTGGDRMAARRMREDFWYFYPTHKIILQGNYKPVVSGTDYGIWSRIHVVPWNATFSVEDKNRVENYMDILRPEANAILSWCVRGCALWQAEGLKKPDAVVKATERFMKEMNHVEEYVNARLRKSPESVISREDVRDDYEAWAAQRKYPAIEARKFTAQLRQVLLDKFGALDTKGRVEGYAYSVRVWKHVYWQASPEAPVVPSMGGRNYDS